MTDDIRSQTEDQHGAPASPQTFADPVGPASPGRRTQRARRARALSGLAASGLALGLVAMVPGTGNDGQTTVCPGACLGAHSAAAPAVTD